MNSAMAKYKSSTKLIIIYWEHALCILVWQQECYLNRKGRCGRLAVFHLVAVDVPRIRHEAPRALPGRNHDAGIVRNADQRAGCHCVCCVHGVRTSGSRLVGTHHHPPSSAWNVSQKTLQNSRGECDSQNGRHSVSAQCGQVHWSAAQSGGDAAA